MKLLFFLTLISSSLYGQVINSYGFVVGITNSTQSYDYSFNENSKELNYRMGVNIGIFAELFETEFFVFRVDLSYAQKGMKDKLVLTKVANNEFGYTSENYTIDNRLDYLTLGTHLKTHYDLKAFAPYLLSGIKYDVLIGKRIDRSLDEFFDSNSGYSNIYEKYDGNLFGLTIGLGIEIKELLSIPLIIEWVYSYDLEKVKINENLKIKNLSNVFKIGLKL